MSALRKEAAIIRKLKKYKPTAFMAADSKYSKDAADYAVAFIEALSHIKPDKEKSTERIDGAVATIMALDRAIRCGQGNSESIYDERGLLIL